jgi:hypothetical protein
MFDNGSLSQVGIEVRELLILQVVSMCPKKEFWCCDKRLIEELFCEALEKPPKLGSFLEAMLKDCALGVLGCHGGDKLAFLDSLLHLPSVLYLSLPPGEEMDCVNFLLPCWGILPLLEAAFLEYFRRSMCETYSIGWRLCDVGENDVCVGVLPWTSFIHDD